VLDLSADPSAASARARDLSRSPSRQNYDMRVSRIHGIYVIPQSLVISPVRRLIPRSVSTIRLNADDSSQRSRVHRS